MQTVTEPVPEPAVIGDTARHCLGSRCAPAGREIPAQLSKLIDARANEAQAT